MPREPAKTSCKICGADATIRHSKATGSNGRVYEYEAYVHKNGTVHYFRLGNDAKETETRDEFEDLIEREMGSGKYRFKEIKRLFESTRGKKVSNVTLQRNIERAMRSNKLKRETEEEMILYSRIVSQENEHKLKIKKAVVTYLLNTVGVTMTALLLFENESDRMLKNMPFSLPVGSLNSVNDIDFKVYDHLGKISNDDIQVTYSYNGQTGILISMNRLLKVSQSSYIFAECSFGFEEGDLKFTLPLDIDSLGVHIISQKGTLVSVRRRFLDGLKEADPNSLKRGTLINDSNFIEAEFENASKGDAIVVSVSPQNTKAWR